MQTQPSVLNFESSALNMDKHGQIYNLPSLKGKKETRDENCVLARFIIIFKFSHILTDDSVDHMFSFVF